MSPDRDRSPDRLNRKNIIVQPIGAEMLPQVEAIMQRAFDPIYGEAWSKAQCLSVYAFTGYQFLGAVAQDGTEMQLSGFAITRTVAAESELLLLATDPAMHNMGIGRALMHYWLETCRQSGTTRAFLEMRHDNSAIHLYRNMDFRDIAVRPGYYRGGDGQSRDAITMQKMLG